jgi:DNA ligase D-like protein (predicted polymerase)
MQPVSTMSAPEEGYFEIFGKGHRAVAEVERGRVQLYSRAFLSFDRKYPAIVQALRSLGHEAVLDGELISEGKKTIYVVSDLLFLDGKDLRELPLRERKAALSKLKLKEPLREAKWATTSKGLLGTVVAKAADSPYRSGLAKDWLRFLARPARAPAKPSRENPPLTHLTKVYWPEEGFTKGDLVRYYDQVAETILPYLVDRPQSMHRQPDGLRNEGFFHKDMSSFLPRRIETVRVSSASSGKTINYVLCQDRWSLLYLVNMGCIELNPWLSKRPKLDHPDMVVIDLDPDENDFDEVIEVAQEVHRVLDAVGADSYCKTSGASGLHICIPTGGRFDFDVGRKFAEAVCEVVNRQFPSLTSVERNPAKRRGRIYLDFLQNRRGQTLAAPYCVRPRPGAPVSTPLKWSEVKPGLRPTAFTIQTMARRLKRVGDLWRPLLNSSVDIEACMKRLSKRFHI